MLRSGPLVLLAGLLLAAPARADVPPPDGQTRVHYLFRVDALPDGAALVAYPSYDTDGGNAIILAAGKDVPSFQGYRPGIYALPAADVAALPRKDHAEAGKYLEAKARQCLKEVPRVFQVATTAGITRMTDVIHVTTAPEGCKVSLVSTLYEGPGGARGEGGLDARGHRTPPAPFGKDDLPAVEGFTLDPSATPPAPEAPPPNNPGPTPVTPGKPEAPPPAAASGCSVAPSPAPWLLAPLALLLRRRTRRA